jgi:uracil-DNA glycosylase
MNSDWASWKHVLSAEFKQPYFRELTDFVREEYKTRTVFPPAKDMFNALKATPYEAANVLILGQDPYHNAGQAHGLCFSVLPGMRCPPSLMNIFKELEADLGIKSPKDGYLQKWAEQGVLLLNSILTVRAHSPGSHKGKGWETFTDAVLRALDAREKPVVFVLWGKYARDKKALISQPRHTVIESSHPSPMSAHDGFLGSRPFSKINQALVKNGLPEIDWQL